MTRVLIVEDHALFADAIKSCLSDQGMQITGICSSGEQALEAVRRDPPDLVLVDVRLAGESGLEVGRKILEELPGVLVVALTALNDPQIARQAVRLGFRGYITKDLPIRQFVRSIQSVLDGQLIVSHRAGRVNGRREEEASALLAAQLTPREREMLALLVEGKSGGEIARSLHLSPNTVRTHIQSVLTKLHVHSRLEAAAFAVRHGIVPIGPDVVRDSA
jgi:two-component system nitrate/nitrite response regulator NarL